jgi:hypothetical protein
MKKLLFLIGADLIDFINNNYKILTLCLITIFFLQYLEKGNIWVNLIVIFIHLVGDVMMIISFKKYAKKETKSGFAYQVSSTIFFVLVGLVAVLQSKDGKNWQYFLGTIPFLVANMYQFIDAYDLKYKRIFNYKLTLLVAITMSILYYKNDLIYSYAWLQVFGYSLFPVFLAMRDSPKIYLCRIFSVFIMLCGVVIDIKVQFVYPGIIPASALSSFFITLIAFFGFIKNAGYYLEKGNSDNIIVLNTLKVLNNVSKAT